MVECPLEYFTDNLVFNRDKSCWALFTLKGFDYDFLSDESKISILNRLTLFIANIETEAQIMMVPVLQDLDARFDSLIAALEKDDPLYDVAVSQAMATKDYLQRSTEVNGRCNDYKTFVAIKLQRADELEGITMLREAFQFMVKSVVNDFDAFLKLDAHDIPMSKIRAFKKMAEHVHADQRKRVALTPTDPETTQWLIRRVMYRGLKKDVKLFQKSAGEPWTPHAKEIKLAGEPYLRPNSRELVNLFSGTILQRSRYLEIQHDEDVSYQTFLAITNIPEESNFPDCEWIYLLQQYNKQAEMHINIKTIEHREAIRKIDGQRRTASSQTDNIAQTNTKIPDDLLESSAAIDGIEAELKTSKFPLIQTSITICLAADSLDELNKKADFVKKEYEDLNFIVERPRADQFSLFMQCIPSVSFCVSDFILRMTPMALAAGVFGATHELGTATGGFFIGTTGVERKPVFFSLPQACLMNISASTSFYGNLGVGKSFNANLVTYLSVITGGYGLIVDPKGERSHWGEKLPALHGLINTVTLSSEKKFAGMLDPFNIFRNDPEEAAELAQNILSELFKIQPKDLEYTALLDALHRIKREPHPAMERLAELLETFQAEDDLCKPARLLARQIRLLQDTGMAQLLIGNGTEEAIRLDNRLNIIQIQNLKLPSPDTKKDDYTSEETTSTVLMMVIAAFCRKFLHSHPNHFKAILFDESWMLGKTSEGEKLMSYGARMSRSLYAAIILNGHSVTDLPNEGIRNSITYKFCFRTSNSAEAARMLDYLKLEQTPSNIDTIMNLGNAQCLFRDLNGHVGILTFDAVFADLIKVFSTTPVDAATIKASAELATPEELEELTGPDTTPEELEELTGPDATPEQLAASEATPEELAIPAASKEDVVEVKNIEIDTDMLVYEKVEP